MKTQRVFQSNEKERVIFVILLIICKSFSKSNSDIPQACKHFLASLSCNSCCSTGSVLVANILTTKPSLKEKIQNITLHKSVFWNLIKTK